MGSTEFLGSKCGVMYWGIQPHSFKGLWKFNFQVEGFWFFSLVNGIDFVRLPDCVQARIYSELTKITDARGNPLQWSMQ